MRKFLSPTKRILDVEATVNWIVDALIVEQEIWLPITKYQSERWLTLELVIEENSSSFIWQETINELEEIFKNYGIFYNVRSWTLSSDHQGNLQLINRKKRKQKNQRQYSYRELYHSNGRGLILLVSDCVSAIWQQKTIYGWLQKWSNQSPTAIMQLLPERLWLSTELILDFKVTLSAFNPIVPNSQLICREDLEIKKNALKLPIITLEPEYLKAWAKVVTGYGNSQTSAIILNLDFVKEPVKQTVTTPSSKPSPEEIVDIFLATASPTAQKLAGLMAAVPVSLPVVHLIQETMLPKSTPVNVAEVFLSGMIERKKDAKNQEVYEYDFVPGVRKLLNQAMPLSETEKVLDVVSEYIAEKMGLSIKSFTARLLKLSDLSQKKQENLLPFAHVAKEVLHNLGEEYAEFANTINIPENTPETPDNVIKFTIATLERRDEEWVINRKSGQAERMIEVLPTGIELELMKIPPGTFLMGAREDELKSSDDERPQHQVTVPSFYMGRYPITQAQWQVVATLPQVNRELDPDPSRFKEGANRPVERVSWDDAVEFCDRLSTHTNKEYRLPSEAEWEYACRAGTTTPFHFGETITTDLANYDGNFVYGDGVKGIYRQKTTEVGSFGVANNFGLCDMHGNVWEWCQDHWHSNYDGAPIDGSAWINSKKDSDASLDNEEDSNVVLDDEENSDASLDDKENSDERLLRGGSWYDIPAYCRSAFRYDDSIDDHHIGFRVVCSGAARTD